MDLLGSKILKNSSIHTIYLFCLHNLIWAFWIICYYGIGFYLYTVFFKYLFNLSIITFFKVIYVLVLFLWLISLDSSKQYFICEYSCFDWFILITETINIWFNLPFLEKAKVLNKMSLVYVNMLIRFVVYLFGWTSIYFISFYFCLFYLLKLNLANTIVRILKMQLIKSL